MSRPSVRFVTFNLRHGRAGRVVDLDQVGQAVADLDPDVLGLQEVDHRQTRSHDADLTAVAAEAMGARASRFVPALLGTPGADWWDVPAGRQPDAAAYGVSLLSRFPVRRWDELWLHGVGPHARVAVPGGPRVVRLGEEPRAVVLAEVDGPTGALLVANTHLSFLPGWQVRQLVRIKARMAETPGPGVLMGDFNLPGPVAARATGFTEAATHRTFPAVRPWWQLDHILLRGAVGTVVRSEARRLPVSDHRALVVDLLPASGPAPDDDYVRPTDDVSGG